MSTVNRRAIRSRSLDHARASFVSCTALGSKPLQILEVSEIGARIMFPSPPLNQKIARDIHDATLFVGEAIRFEIRIKIVHILGNSVGVEFISPSDRMRTALRAFYGPELEGASLGLKESTPERVLFDGEKSCVELQLRSGMIESFKVRTPTVSGEFRIHPNGTDAGIELAETERRMLVRFISNLNPLHIAYQHAMTAAIANTAMRSD